MYWTHVNWETFILLQKKNHLVDGCLFFPNDYPMVYEAWRRDGPTESRRNCRIDSCPLFDLAYPMTFSFVASIYNPTAERVYRRLTSRDRGHVAMRKLYFLRDQMGILCTKNSPDFSFCQNGSAQVRLDFRPIFSEKKGIGFSRIVQIFMLI